MARRRASAAVVVDSNTILGIFTTIDALHTLAYLAAPPEERTIYEALKDAAVEVDRR